MNHPRNRPASIAIESDVEALVLANVLAKTIVEMAEADLHTDGLSTFKAQCTAEVLKAIMDIFARIMPSEDDRRLILMDAEAGYQQQKA